jgi:adenylate kinase family enzyme
MKLVDLILENTGKPKAIIVAGSGGSGKSYLALQLGIEDLEMFNMDDFVERQGFSLVNARMSTDLQINQAMGAKKNFVWQTTAGSPNIKAKIESIVNAGYEVFMIMVYTHPFIAFLQNFERDVEEGERRLPQAVIFSTWKNTYAMIDDYRQLLGKNFILTKGTDENESRFGKDVQEFNNAVKRGSSALAEFIKEYTSKDPSRYKSSFSKTPEEVDIEFEKLSSGLQDRYIQFTQHLPVREEDRDMVKYLKKHYIDLLKKDKNVSPKIMQTEYNRVLSQREKSKLDKQTSFDAITDTLFNPEFVQKINSAESLDSIKGKVQAFIKN